MPTKLTRRDFLRSTGQATLPLSLEALLPIGWWKPSEEVPESMGAAKPTAASVAAPPVPEYRGWEDVFRQKWTWDRVVRCTHNRANCMSACAWDVYVKDGIAWREEQAAAYDEGGRGGARRTSSRAAARRAPATAG